MPRTPNDERKKLSIIQGKQCVLPCSRPMPEYDTHQFCFAYLGEICCPLRWSMAIANSVKCSQLKCFALALLTSKGQHPQWDCGAHVSIWLRSKRQVHHLSLFRPGCPIAWLWSVPQRLFGSDRGQWISCFLLEELLEVVTREVARFQLDWPREQETPNAIWGQISVQWPRGGTSTSVSPLLWVPPWQDILFMGETLYIAYLCAFDIYMFNYCGCEGTQLYDDASGWRSRAISRLGLHRH